MGGDTMVKETTKIESRKGSHAVSHQDTAMSVHNTCHEDSSLKSSWKKTILELSQKEGYTGIAL
jgi:hypothetical protein